MPSKQVPVQLETYNITSTGFVTVCSYSTNERIKRAAMRFVAGISISILCILIPIAHFILVPLALLLTPFLAYKIFQQNESIQGGEGPCPKCNAKVTFSPRSVKWPLEETCPSCSRPILISLLPIN